MSGNIEHVSPCFSCVRVCPVQRMLEVGNGADCQERFNMKTGFVKQTCKNLDILLHTNNIYQRDDKWITKRAKREGFVVKIVPAGDERSHRTFYLRYE